MYGIKRSYLVSENVYAQLARIPIWQFQTVEVSSSPSQVAVRSVKKRRYRLLESESILHVGNGHACLVAHI